MNKELFSFLFVFISLLVGALYYTNAIQSPLIETTSYFKNTYHQSIKSIQEGFSKHFYQAQKIKNSGIMSLGINNAVKGRNNFSRKFNGIAINNVNLIENWAA
jgi:hypothetical protein